MWVYRLGAERAKRMLLTGDTIDGVTAAAWGLVLQAVPAGELDGAVEALADRIAWRDSGRPIPDGGGPVPATAELDEE